MEDTFLPAGWPEIGPRFHSGAGRRVSATSPTSRLFPPNPFCEIGETPEGAEGPRRCSGLGHTVRHHRGIAIGGTKRRLVRQRGPTSGAQARPPVDPTKYIRPQGTPEAPSSAPTLFREDPFVSSPPGTIIVQFDITKRRLVRKRGPTSGAQARPPVDPSCRLFFSYTGAGNTGGADFGADVVPGRPIRPYTNHHCPN